MGIGSGRLAIWRWWLPPKPQTAIITRSIVGSYSWTKMCVVGWQFMGVYSQLESQQLMIETIIMNEQWMPRWFRCKSVMYLMVLFSNRGWFCSHLSNKKKHKKLWLLCNYSKLQKDYYLFKQTKQTKCSSHITDGVCDERWTQRCINDTLNLLLVWVCLGGPRKYRSIRNEHTSANSSSCGRSVPDQRIIEFGTVRLVA